MSPKQNLLALIATFLFSITLAFADTANSTVVATNTSPSASTTPSVANDTFSAANDPDPILCDINNYKQSFLSRYDEVADHLRHMTGNATLGNKPGGGWCFRYSCANNLAIYGCNDNQADTQVPWATMATYADAIKGKCKTTKLVHGHRKGVVLGQAFDAGGWNVILGIASGQSC